MSETMEELTERLIEESAEAKQMLRDYGFGVTGTPLLATVKEALDALDRLGWEKP